MQLSWNPPKGNTGPINYYIVGHKPFTSTQWTERKEFSTNTTLHVKCGLEDDGVQYDISVTAVSIDEEGNVLRGDPVEWTYELCESMPGKVVCLSFCLSLCLSVCLSVCVYVCLSVYLPACPPARLSFF